MIGYVSHPATDSGQVPSGPTPEANGRQPCRGPAAGRFLLLSLAGVLAGSAIYHIAREGVTRAVAEAGEAAISVLVDTAAASAAVILVLLMLTVGGWLLERARKAKARARDEAARRRMAARLHFLAMHASDCIILCDASGRILEGNARCLGTYGYSQEEWLRLNMNDVIAEKHFVLPGLVQQIAEERGVVYESRHARKDGTAFDVEMHASLTEVDGKSCYQLIVRDVSEQKKFRQEQAACMRRLSELARRLVNVQEAERQRLAGELHDQVGANLATINLNLRSISRMMPDPDPQLLHDRLKEAGGLLADTIFSIRNACTELRPAVLYYSGLVPALEDLVQRVGRRGDMKVRFRQEGMHERLPPHAESMLFRIAQEALTNCAKHSHARAAEIVISRQQRAVIMSVSDNGTGFDPGLPGRLGLGLLTMRERAAMAGGELFVLSRPGKGAQIRVVVALAQAPAAGEAVGAMRA